MKVSAGIAMTGLRTLSPHDFPIPEASHRKRYAGRLNWMPALKK